MSVRTSINASQFQEVLLRTEGGKALTNVMLEEWSKMWTNNMQAPEGWTGLAVPTGSGKTSSILALAAAEPTGGRRICIAVLTKAEAKEMERTITALRKDMAQLHDWVADDHSLAVVEAVTGDEVTPDEKARKAEAAQIVITTHSQLKVCFAERQQGRMKKFNSFVADRLLVIDEHLNLVPSELVSDQGLEHVAMEFDLALKDTEGAYDDVSQSWTEELQFLKEAAAVIKKLSQKSVHNKPVPLTDNLPTPPESYPSKLLGSLSRVIKLGRPEVAADALLTLQELINTQGTVVTMQTGFDPVTHKPTKGKAVAIKEEAGGVQAALVFDGTASVTPPLGDLVEGRMKVVTPDQQMRSYANLNITLVEVPSVGKDALANSWKWVREATMELGRRSDHMALLVGSAKLLRLNAEPSKDGSKKAGAWSNFFSRDNEDAKYSTTYFGEGGGRGTKGTNAFKDYDQLLICCHEFWPGYAYQVATMSRDHALVRKLASKDTRTRKRAEAKLVEDVTKMRHSTLAAEVVQCVNRLRCRVSQEGGACAPTSAYVFVPTQGSQADMTPALLEVLKKELPEVVTSTVTYQEFTKSLGLSVQPTWWKEKSDIPEEGKELYLHICEHAQWGEIKISQEEQARLLGIPVGQVSKYLKNRFAQSKKQAKTSWPLRLLEHRNLTVRRDRRGNIIAAPVGITQARASS